MLSRPAMSARNHADAVVIVKAISELLRDM